MINAAEMAQAAEAARLEIAADEKEDFLAEINGLFAFVRNRWEPLDVQDVPPTTHPRPLTNIHRPDTPGSSLPLDTALVNAPEADEGCFRVPRIIEE